MIFLDISCILVDVSVIVVLVMIFVWIEFRFLVIFFCKKKIIKKIN